MLLILGSISILSWYNLTRHWQSTSPNGETSIDGYIFKWWSLFWEKVIYWERDYFYGKEFERKVMEMNRLEKNLLKNVKVSFEHGLIVDDNSALGQQDIFNIESLCSCKVFKEENFYYLFLPKPIYRFPKWVRNPLSHCPTCMASVYGSIIWWGVVCIDKDIFLWSQYHFICNFVFWFFYCLILSRLNTILNDKNIF